MRFSSYLTVKRIFDVFYASVGLLASTLPLSCIAAAVKITSEGPFIFRQTRIGRDGVPFVCYKIRTMKNGTPQSSAAKLKSSDFITPVGAFLRSYSLDELTQFINVLRGDMSVIGPRPLIPEERELHRMRTERGVYRLRPGISGLSQINGRDDLTDKHKAKLDMIYLQNFSFWLDAFIFLRTFSCLHHGQKGKPHTMRQNKQEHTKKRSNSRFILDFF